MDMMMSFMLGLPSNIDADACDTKSPRNLSDSDFDADTQVLPPSRSEDDPTKMLWFIVKERLMPNFSKVCQDALGFKEKTEEEIIELDQDIRKMHTTIPTILRTRSLSDSIAEDPFLIMTRIYIEMIYLKSLCVLHRKYMARGVDYKMLRGSRQKNCQSVHRHVPRVLSRGSAVQRALDAQQLYDE